MNRPGLAPWRACVLFVALAATPLTTRAVNLFELAPDTTLELADADQALEQLRGFLWRAQEDPPPVEKDFRGVKFSDDANAILLVDPARQRLDAAMTAARTQTDPKAARKALDEARDRIVNQRDRMMVLIAYWGMQMAVDRHATLLAPALAETSDEAETTRKLLAVDSAGDLRSATEGAVGSGHRQPERASSSRCRSR